MVTTVNVGTLRHRIEIQRSTRSRTAQGTQVDTFSTIATRYGSIREDREEKFIVIMRHFPGLIPTAKKLLDADGEKISVHRLKHETRILNIEDVLDLESKGQLMRIICTRDDETF